MSKFVLYDGEVWKVIREDHFGDSTNWFLSITDPTIIWNRWVPADKCTPLDPALNVLFERKENG